MGKLLIVCMLYLMICARQLLSTTYRFLRNQKILQEVNLYENIEKRIIVNKVTYWQKRKDSGDRNIKRQPVKLSKV